jgi:cephalosporin hydroxylase
LNFNFINKFHKHYYNSNVWKNTYWLGVETQKYPQDLWIYQEIIFDIKPDLIIETGTLYGGSALYLASVCDLVGKGNILSIDIEYREDRPKHNRITYLLGDSTSVEIFKLVKEYTLNLPVIMVILDSDHSREHVLDEMNLYSKLVTIGSFLIVEDTNINGHPVFPKHGPGPMEAAKEFLKINKDFLIAKDKEKFFISANPSGYLIRSN